MRVFANSYIMSCKIRQIARPQLNIGKADGGLKASHGKHIAVCSLRPVTACLRNSVPLGALVYKSVRDPGQL